MQQLFVQKCASCHLILVRQAGSDQWHTYQKTESELYAQNIVLHENKIVCPACWYLSISQAAKTAGEVT